MLNGIEQDWLEAVGGGKTEGRAKISIWPPRNEQRCPLPSVQADQSRQVDAYARLVRHDYVFSSGQADWSGFSFRRTLE